ncbi:MAG TPA: nuclear transport factor 2 family protein [Allosphingosinicella sp.]|nr:nuclear transport factor 2 family protein [Allosphingosinicella sp.]
MIVALLIALAAPEGAGDRVVASASPDIDRANAEWAVAIRSGDAARLAAPYAEDGIFIGPGGNVVKGRKAVEALYAAGARASSHIVGAGIKSGGRVAADANDVYEWGEAWLRVRAADGKLTRRGGRFLTVWHLYGGHWMITRNIAF